MIKQAPLTISIVLDYLYDIGVHQRPLMLYFSSDVGYESYELVLEMLHSNLYV
jgi:hypothetical protein